MNNFSIKKTSPFILALLAGMIFLIFRSTELASDGTARVEIVAAGDLQESQYTGWQHFSQAPLARLLFLFSEKFQIGWTPMGALVFFGLLGNLLSLFFLYKIADYRQKSSWAAWGSGVLLCFSPAIFFYWNGELLNLALGLSFCALSLAIRGSPLIWVALPLSLATLSRIDFVLIAPGLVWFQGRYQLNTRDFILFVRKTFFLTLFVSLFSGIILYFSLIIMGAVNLDPHSVLRYIQKSYAPFDYAVIDYSIINSLKACKHLASTISPSIHSLSELLRGTRGHLSYPTLLTYALYALFVLALTITGLIFLFRSAARQRDLRPKLVGVFLLIFPVQLLFNWRYSYQSEEYHASSMVGLFYLVFLLLHEVQKIKYGKIVTSILIAIFSFGFLILYAVPAMQFPLDQLRAGAFLSAESKISHSKITLLVCDFEISALKIDSGSIRQVPFLGLSRNWLRTDAGSVTSNLKNLISHELMDPANRVMITGNRCNLKYLTRPLASKPNVASVIESINFNDIVPGFSLQRLTAPLIPLNWYNQYDPISWRYETLYEFKRIAKERSSTKVGN